MNDEQKAQLEEVHSKMREEANYLIELGETDIILEKICFYAELAETLARALVNKTKE